MTMFEGKIAVVTGGGNGIGQALSARLTEQGAVVAVADIDSASAARVAASIGGSARSYGCDVTDVGQLSQLASDVERDLGPPQLVFINAGVMVGGSVTDTEAKDFQWMFDVNVTGAFNTIKAFAPGLVETAKAGETARFIFTGSENSIGVSQGGVSSIYTATKHALLGLADSLRRDLKDSNVGVTIFCPGMVATQLWDARRQRHDRYGGSTAMPEDYGQRVTKIMSDHGLPADLTARLVLEGVQRGEFLVINDPRIRPIVEARAVELGAALDRADAALA